MRRPRQAADEKATGGQTARERNKQTNRQRGHQTKENESGKQSLQGTPPPPPTVRFEYQTPRSLFAFFAVTPPLPYGADTGATKAGHAHALKKSRETPPAAPPSPPPIPGPRRNEERERRRTTTTAPICICYPPPNPTPRPLISAPARRASSPSNHTDLTTHRRWFRP